MRGQTREQHDKMCDGIKDALQHLRDAKFDSAIIDFMESSSLAMIGEGKRGIDRCGPEINVSGHKDEPLGTSERHESYGQISFSRINATPPINLYGSNIKHGSIISLTIRRSAKNHNLYNDTYYGDEEIIDVYMSPAQFAELLTSLNVGSGVPCTIQHIFYHRMSGCPEENQRKVNKQEFEETCKEIVHKSQSLIAEVTHMFESKKNINKTDRKDIIGNLQHICNIFTSRIPFIKEQYDEAMEKTETEVKAAVDNFVTHALVSIGAKALKNKLIELPNEMKQIESENKYDSTSST